MLKAYRFKRDAPAQVTESHSEGQAFVLTGGAIRLFVRDRTCLVAPGRLCWIPPGAEHGFVSNGPVRGISVKAGRDLCDGLPEIGRVLEADPLHGTLMRRLVDRPEDGDVVWPMLRRVLRKDREDRLTLPAPRDPRLVRLAEALARSPDDNRDLADWAAAVGMSPRTLMRRFAAETGLSFALWRRGQRLLIAIEMMQAGRSATAAAHDCGFASSSAFSAAFRSHTGLSPTDYLKSRPF